MRAAPGAWRRLARFWERAAQLRRLSAFSLVGILGIFVQLATLAVLTGWLGLHYLVGTGLAVEAAVLHNFVWHEHWTWSDRAGLDKAGMLRRLVRFHLANGALSLGGNLVLMRLFVGFWSMNYAVANMVSITICSVLNFLASDRFVFEETLKKAEARGRAFRIRRRPPEGVVTSETTDGAKTELPTEATGLGGEGRGAGPAEIPEPVTADRPGEESAPTPEPGTSGKVPV